MWLLQVVFLWLHRPAAANRISPFDAFVEPHGRAVLLLFVGQTLPTYSPSPPVLTLLYELSCRRSCRGIGSQTRREAIAPSAPHLRMCLMFDKVFSHWPMCGCVLFPFILDIKFLGSTTRGHTGGRPHRIFSSTFLLWCILVFFSREGFSRSFPSSTVKSRFVLLFLLLFPHISPISRTRGHRRRLPFPYHRYIQKHK